MHHRLRTNAVGFIAALALTVGLAACGSDSKSSSTTSADTVEATDPVDTADTAATTARASTAVATTIGRPTTSRAAATTSEAAASTSAAATTLAPATTAATATTSAGGTATVPATWVSYTSPQGDFVVAFPATPNEQTQGAPLPDGSTLTLDIVGSSTGQTFVGTARGEYPAGYTLDIDQALQGAQDQAIANVNGTLIEGHDIELQGRRGREFSATLTNNGVQGTVIQRVYVDDLTIYQNIVTGPGTITASDAPIAAFLGSFQFTS